MVEVAKALGGRNVMMKLAKINYIPLASKTKMCLKIITGSLILQINSRQ